MSLPHLDFAQEVQARKSLASGSDLFESAANLARFDQLKRDYKPKELTFGHILRGAVGSALGAGIAKGVTGLLGLSDSTRQAIINYGANAGALYNSGYFKGASDMTATERRHAFRLGFMKAAMEKGLIKSAAVVAAPIAIPLSPDALGSPVRAVSNATSGLAQGTSALLGSLNAPDEGDVDVAKLEVHRELLRDRLRQLEAARRSRLIKEILAKRAGNVA